MKYLFDENCSVSDKFLELHPGCENVKYHLEQGVKDDTILQRANKEEFVIVTKDIEFALDALIEKFKIIFHDVERNQDYFLQTGTLESEIISEYGGFELK